MEKSKKPLLVWQIAKINLRHNFLPLLFLSFIIMLLVPVIFGITNLDNRAAAAPLEMLISTLGIVLLVPVFQPEQNPDIEDIVSSKYVDQIIVHLIRIAYSLVSLVLLIALFSLVMILNGCEITLIMYFGTIADAMFLGAIGLLTAAITNNLTVSFMPPIIYYLLNITMQRKLGVFNLFAMMNENYAPNVWLFLTGITLIVVSVLIKRVITKQR